MNAVRKEALDSAYLLDYLILSTPPDREMDNDRLTAILHELGWSMRQFANLAQCGEYKARDMMRGLASVPSFIAAWLERLMFAAERVSPQLGLFWIYPDFKTLCTVRLEKHEKAGESRLCQAEYAAMLEFHKVYQQPVWPDGFDARPPDYVEQSFTKLGQYQASSRHFLRNKVIPMTVETMPDVIHQARNLCGLNYPYADE